jgi:hypothetical protein
MRPDAGNEFTVIMTLMEARPPRPEDLLWEMQAAIALARFSPAALRGGPRTAVGTATTTPLATKLT